MLLRLQDLGEAQGLGHLVVRREDLDRLVPRASVQRDRGALALARVQHDALRHGGRVPLDLGEHARGEARAPRLLAEIERHAARVTDRVVLHTGERQQAAIALYRRSGYEPIEIYPPYDEVPESLCFAKILRP